MQFISFTRPKHIRFVFYISGSMYRFQYDGRCEFDLLFYNSQSQANWSRKNGRALPAVRGEISNTEI